MKKFTLVSLFALQLFFVSAYSQSIHLYTLKGQDVTGSEIHVYCNYMDSHELPFNVKNVSNVDGDFKVKKDEVYMAEGSAANFCWKNCYGQAAIVSDPVTYKANETKAKGFYADFFPMFSEGDSYIRFMFYNDSDESDSASVNVYYHASASAIDSVVVIAKTVGINDVRNKESICPVYPNPTNGLSSVAYKIDDDFSKAKYLVANMLGEIVFEIPVYNKEGILNLDFSNLNAGIYLGSLVIDGKNARSEKILVKH